MFDCALEVKKTRQHGRIRIDKLKLIEIQFKLLIAFSAHFRDLRSSPFMPVWEAVKRAMATKSPALKHLKNDSRQSNIWRMTRLF